jgi:hypothetical protein
MIADCARLLYLRPDDYTLDPTHEKGTWWKQWRPNKLETNDIDKDGWDFRDAPYDDETFDAIAYDPPYVCVGGRRTSTLKGFQNAYGIDTAPKTPEALQALINDGLTEMHRLVKPRVTKKFQLTRPNGIVLVKCQDYTSGGHMWPGTHYTLEHAFALGFTLWDRLEYLTKKARAQPTNRTRKDGKTVRQEHARRNVSTLLVLRKG